MQKKEQIRKIANLLKGAEAHPYQPLPEDLNLFPVRLIIKTCISLINHKIAVNSSLRALEICGHLAEGKTVDNVCEALSRVMMLPSQSFTFWNRCYRLK